MSFSEVFSSDPKRSKMARNVCSVPGCDSDSGRQQCKLLTWHRVPEGKAANPWLLAARLSEVSREKDVKDMLVCSLHFKPSDFDDENPSGLKESVVPSRFPWFHSSLKTVLRSTDLELMTKDKPSDQGKCLKPNLPKEVKMDDDDIEVIEELTIEPTVEGSSKKPVKHMSDGDYPESKRKCIVQDAAKVGSKRHVLIKKEYIENTGNLIPQEHNDTYKNRLEGVRKALDRLAELIKQTRSVTVSTDAKLRRASYLMNIPINPCVNYRAPQKPHNHGILSSARSQNAQPAPISSVAPKEQPNTDGLQIVHTVVASVERNLPPPGAFKPTEITLNVKVYGMKTDLYGVWHRAVVLDISGEGSEKRYKIKFEPFSKTAVVKTCSAKEIAYEKPADVRLPFGKRIIASYRPEEKTAKSAMYAGIIAEPPKSTNRFRYLVFFDDGYAQYTEHCDIRVVCEESEKVWEDIHPDCRDFIKGYCEQFPERPMLKLQKNQVIKTEYNSGWWYAKVVDVDASMVRMYFEQENRYEWIYRGSTRLAPLYNELEKAKHSRMSGKLRRHNLSAARKNKDRPYVEYTVAEVQNEIVLDSDESDAEKSAVEKPVKRNVAIKSTTQVKKPERDDSQEVKNREGEYYFIDIPNFTRPRYVAHECGLSCAKNYDLSKFKYENPLRIPMYLGWERQVKKYKLRSYSLVVQYRAPCGRLLRNIEEVNRYLLCTESKLTVDLFTFDPNLCPLQSFRTLPEEALWSCDDITEGKENVPIPCVNCLTNEKPIHVDYATERFPGKGVTLNLDKEFLCGCDCTDNCQDPSRCQCQQLTIRAYSKEANVKVGYHYRRLKEPIVTGLYECNVWCSCNSSCMNRVVQNGLQIRLQMFKTAKKGWGIRCLDDVDAGMFLCIYAGQLLTEQGADEDGHEYGDEYLAELDHIEVAEKMKEGYESDIGLDIDIGDIEDCKQESGDSKGDMDADSDEETSETSSTKSNSSQNSVSHDSDPEFEGSTPKTTSVYATRSKNKNIKKKKFSLFSESDYALDSDSNSSKPSVDEKKELPDLAGPTTAEDLKPIIPRPLSPFSAEELEKLEIGRKPKIDDYSDNGTDRKPKMGVNMKKFQNLVLKQPLPPPTPPEEKKSKHVSVRSYFNEDYCYIMDAKSKGNIGRYLNHSCSPNSFVQNVFMDTHDLRFPTVAFFASDRIKAGTELTWDYNYEVGSVKGKVMYCYCESPNCRGRLL